MKLLVLSSRPPWPPAMADQMTLHEMIRFLAGRGHAVDLACLVRSEEEGRALREGLVGCRRIETVALPRWRSFLATARSLPSALPMQVAYFRSASLRARVERMVADERYDLVYTHLIRMAEYSRRLRLPKVVGLQVSQALNYGRMRIHARSPLHRFFYGVEERRVRPYEAGLCREFDRVLLTGRRDVEELARTVPVDNAVVCPHGQDIPALERVRRDPKVPGAVVFSGVMGTNTNVDAITWFAREIFPRVERAVPEAKLWVVGRRPHRAVRALARPGRVEITGEVLDVYDYLCRAEVAVDPLRMGAGMQNKVIQAMACELPVVATAVANEGIGAAPEEEILVRDAPEAFADAVVALLRDRGLRERIGRRARAYVDAHWTWESHFLKFEALLEEVVSGRGAGG